MIAEPWQEDVPLPPDPDPDDLEALADEPAGEPVDPFPEPEAVPSHRLAHALRLAAAGYPILPIWSTLADGTCRCRAGARCRQKPGKHPYSDESRAHGFRDATTDPERIRTFMAAASRPNYGFVPRPGELALDIDGEGWQGRIAALEAEHGPLPPTMTTRTPNGGEHRVFRWPADVPRATGAIFGFVTRWGEDPGMGYIVGPGSENAGRPYLAAGGPEAVAVLPVAWAEAAPPAPATAAPGTGITIDCLACGRLEERYGAGARYPAIAKLTLRMHTMGHGLAVQWEHVRDHLAPRFDPPKTTEELRQDFDAATHDRGRMDRMAREWQATHPNERDRETPGEADPPTIGTRTALELDAGPPPPQLADPFLAARGATCIYGKGGTGKGITTAYLIRRLVRGGHVVMVLDYEGHPEEWGSRLRGLGLTDDELRRVIYREPYGPEWTATKGPLRTVAHLVRDDAAAVGATVLVVDSYTTATSTGDTMGGQAAAQEFFAGCAMVGLPVLFLAHVRGEAQRFPERPFGSVFVHNLARETWAVEALPRDDDDPENLFAPSIVRLELRNMKRNRGGRQAPQFLTFAFNADGSIDATDGAPGRRSVADLIDAVLDTPMTSKQIAAAIREDTGETPGEESVRRTLGRYPRRFVADTTKRPRKWSRRP